MASLWVARQASGEPQVPFGLVIRNVSVVEVNRIHDSCDDIYVLDGTVNCDAARLKAQGSPPERWDWIPGSLPTTFDQLTEATSEEYPFSKEVNQRVTHRDNRHVMPSRWGHHER